MAPRVDLLLSLLLDLLKRGFSILYPIVLYTFPQPHLQLTNGSNSDTKNLSFLQSFKTDNSLDVSQLFSSLCS